MAQIVEHTLLPIYDSDSQILILGTMPSPKSREVGFYYGHPKNRFWRVMEAVGNVEELNTLEAKEKFLHEKHIALWDVLKSCDIDGASDGSIKNPVPNDINMILEHTNVGAVFTTGAVAYKLYMKLCADKTGIDAVRLPSTSPANCAFSIERLIQQYKIINEYLGK